MAISNKLPSRMTGYTNKGMAHSEQIQRLASDYRDKLIERLTSEEQVELSTLEPQLRETKLEGLVRTLLAEEKAILNGEEIRQIIDIIQHEVVGLGPLQPLLRQDGITEIMVNWVKESSHDQHGYSRIFIERDGQIEQVPDIKFRDAKHLRHIIDRIVSPLGRRIDESSPKVDARLPEGHRVNAIIPPLAVDGPILTIRKFREYSFTDKDLIEKETLSAEMIEFLQACVRAKLNVLISGGTGSGKTTTLNVLSSFIPQSERIVTIEDAAELRFHNRHKHVVRLETRPPNVEGVGEVTMQELVKNALRMRPDRIVVGEVRGGEALDMLQAMNTGHEGSMTSVHANTPRDAFSRLENMIMMAESAKQLPVLPIREQLARAIDIVVQQSRLPTGERKITNISEVIGLHHGEYVMRDIFLFQQVGTDAATNKVIGYFSPTGVIPAKLQKIRAALDVSETHGIEKLFSLDYFTRELGVGLLKDRTISEIMINGTNDIYVEQFGKLRPLAQEEIEKQGGSGIQSAHQLRHIVSTVAARLGRTVDDKRPMLDIRLPDGSRVNVVMPPITLHRTGQKSQNGSRSNGRDTGEKSPVITIRRFPDRMLIDHLIERASISPPMARFIDACIQARLNILISGGTGSGKTTMLNVMSSFITDNQRIVTIEDVAELRLTQPHWVRLETRPPDEFGEGEVSIRDLVRNSLRMRPDRIIVGECRGAEALDMLQAMNTGHSGSITTLHANSPDDAFSRLETMVRMAKEAKELSPRELASQMSVVDVIVQIGRCSDGSRKVYSINEVVHTKGADDALQAKPVFIYHQRGVMDDANKSVLGEFRPTGYIPAFQEKLQAIGLAIDESIFDADEPDNVLELQGQTFVKPLEMLV